MKAPALLTTLGALAAAAVLAALWLRHERVSADFAWTVASPAAVAASPDSSANRPSRPAAATVAAPTSSVLSEAPPPVDLGSNLQAPSRDSEAQLASQLTQRVYARAGGAVVDELVAHGLARSDSERIVRDFFAGAVGCFFTALREEAGARSLDYDPLLDALEAEIYDTDGALLTALIDMAAVATRASACELSVAEQAGIPPSIMATAARAAAR